MSMEVNNTYGNYENTVYTEKQKQNVSESAKGKEGNQATKRTNSREYKNYLMEKYDCLKSKEYSVSINSSLLTQAVGDEKTAKWLEENLALIPKCVDKMMAAAEACGSRVISCNISINGYDNISTEMCGVFEADPGTDKIRERTEEAIKRRREEKKAEEKKQAERQEKERLEELAAENKDERAVTITGSDIKDITSRFVASIRGEVSVSSFDIRA